MPRVLLLVGADWLSGVHSGKSRKWYLAHVPQSSIQLYCLGHKAHLAPTHWLRQVQLQPVLMSPDTVVAWPVQSSATVQMREHKGKLSVYVPLTLQALQFAVLLKFAGHTEQLADTHLLMHVHVHPEAKLPVTMSALPLQSRAMVHSLEQLGNGVPL